MLRLILGFSSLGAFGPDSRPRILTNLVLLAALSTRPVATTIKDSSNYDISNSEHSYRAKRIADDAELLELDNLPGRF